MLHNKLSFRLEHTREIYIAGGQALAMVTELQGHPSNQGS